MLIPCKLKAHHNTSVETLPKVNQTSKIQPTSVAEEDSVTFIKFRALVGFKRSHDGVVS